MELIEPSSGSLRSLPLDRQLLAEIADSPEKEGNPDPRRKKTARQAKGKGVVGLEEIGAGRVGVLMQDGWLRLLEISPQVC